MSARRIPRIAIVVVALLVAGCSASGEGATPRGITVPPPGTDVPGTTEPAMTTITEPAPPPEAPQVGACWSALSADEIDAFAFPGDEVDCDEPHGSVTVAVLDIDADQERDLDEIDLDTNDPDDDTVELVQSVGQACTSEWNDVVEGSGFDTEALLVSQARRTTNLGFSFWLPTDDQWEAGARWLRCDLQAYDTTFDLDLEGLKALADEPVPAELVLCLTGDAGIGVPVKCDSPDANYQSIAEFQITREAAPSGQEEYDMLIERLAISCAQLTEEAVGPVGERQFRVFAVEEFDLSDGEFTCAAKVSPPVTEPLGT